MEEVEEMSEENTKTEKSRQRQAGYS